MLWLGENPFICKCPVDSCSDQCKHWSLPIFFFLAERKKTANRVRSPFYFLIWGGSDFWNHFPILSPHGAHLCMIENCAHSMPADLMHYLWLTAALYGGKVWTNSISVTERRWRRRNLQQIFQRVGDGVSPIISRRSSHPFWAGSPNGISPSRRFPCMLR